MHTTSRSRAPPSIPSFRLVGEPPIFFWRGVPFLQRPVSFFFVDSAKEKEEEKEKETEKEKEKEKETE